MAKPFDAATRELIELGPAAWLEYLRIPVPAPGRVQVIDSDVSTVTAETDKVLWIEGDEPWVVHVELQARRDARLADRLHRYNALLSYRHEVPVRSVAVLLRPEADAPELSGRLEKALPGAGAYLSFRYDVVRVWRQPVEAVLAGGLATLPLAPVSDVGSEEPSRVMMVLADRYRREASSDQAILLWTATEVLMRLRYRADQIDDLIRGAQAMIQDLPGVEETWIYRSIFSRGEAKGREEEAREILLRQGRKKLGPPDERVRAAIQDLTELERLDQLLERILDVSSWDELLPPPG